MAFPVPYLLEVPGEGTAMAGCRGGTGVTEATPDPRGPVAILAGRGHHFALRNERLGEIVAERRGEGA